MKKILLYSIFILSVYASSLSKATYRINSTSAFIKFSFAVNTGFSFNGTTVVLESDMDFSGTSTKFSPIGSSSKTPFLGTFDGQGYSIQHLTISPAANATTTGTSRLGLFGYSRGATIRNIVIDSSCAVRSDMNDNYGAVLSSVLATCHAEETTCVVRNIVNVGAVSFSGDIYKQSLLLSGIVGICAGESLVHRCVIRNCANYGSVVNTGSCGTAYIGGLIAYGMGSQSHRCIIQNCLSHGPVSHTGTAINYLSIGGIAGYVAKKGWIDNCVFSGSLGVVQHQGGSTEELHPAAIVGGAKASTIIHCYWSDAINYTDTVGEADNSYVVNCTTYDPSTYILKSTESSGVGKNVPILQELNARADNYTLREYLHWGRTENNSTVRFEIVNRNPPLLLSKTLQLFMLPGLANLGSMMFSGWYADSNCTVYASGFVYKTDTTLYAKWVDNRNYYAITFDARNGKEKETMYAMFNEKISLPRPVREGYVIEWWEDDHGDEVSWDFIVPAQNVTLVAVWACIHIQNANDLLDFSKIVRSGVTYNGSTVYLDNDIDLTDIDFPAIGINLDNCFLGTFDGQGHTISNMNIPMGFNYTALFSMSLGLTIRNTVLDSTCTVRYAEKQALIGSLLGYCSATGGPCTVENCVSMAKIDVSKASAPINSLDTTYAGGLVGCMESAAHPSTVRNCAVYADASYNKVKAASIVLGGLVGSCFGGMNNYCYIHNNLFAGTIKRTTFLGEEYVIIGGIVGVDSYAEYRNCVNIGDITYSGKATTYVGKIVGYIGFLSLVSHCFWDSASEAYGIRESHILMEDSTCFDPDTLELCEPVTIGTYYTSDVLDALNTYTQKYYVYVNFSYWISNSNQSTIDFVVSKRDAIHLSVQTRLVLAPNIMSTTAVRMFGWYTNENCTELLEDFTITQNTTLYAVWKEDARTYTITFDTLSRRPTKPVEKINAEYMQTVMLPQNLEAENASGKCVFRGWHDKYSALVPNEFTVPAKNVTLYAAWFCTHITSKNEFYELSRAVNSVSDLVVSNTTIYLDADIDFADYPIKVPPVGKYAEYDDDYYFKGTFDGQGHTISNIVIASNEGGTGLFGYSFHGMSVRNVVLDSSCSIFGVSSSSNANLGGIIGSCIGGKAACSVMNSINMAPVAFKNALNEDKSNVGGIVGYCGAYFSECLVVNCANYGTVSYYGNHIISSVGGITGQCYGYTAENKCRTLNSVNYGNIMQSSSMAEYAFAGGIMGYSKRYNEIENCANMGKISFSGSAYTVSSGTIVGYLQKSSMQKCFSQVSGNVVPLPYGKIDESALSMVNYFRNTTFTINTTDDPILDVLNSNRSPENFSPWALNRNSSTIAFMLNNLHYVTTSAQVILVPDLKSTGEMTFRGWYVDNETAAKFAGTEFTADTTLWGYFEPVYTSRSGMLALIIFIAALCLLLAIILVIGCIVGKMIYNKVAENRVIRELIEPLLPDPLSSSLNDMDALYPEDYSRPSLRVALVNAGFSNAIAAAIARECYCHAEELSESGKIHGDITVDDAAAIALYTMDGANIKAIKKHSSAGGGGDDDDDDDEGDENEKTPYRMINSALAAGTEEALEPVKDLLYFVMVALRKLPIVHGKPLYRGICSGADKMENYSVTVSTSGSINMSDECETTPKVLRRKGKTSNYVEINSGSNGYDEVAYKEGDEAVWRAISSTSPDISVTKSFLAKDIVAMKAVGTLFIIEKGWGYDVQPYSMFPDEEEIVIEPERLFRVTSVIPGEGLTIIRLEMLKTPLPLLGVFGQKKLSLI